MPKIKVQCLCTSITISVVISALGATPRALRKHLSNASINRRTTRQQNATYCNNILLLLNFCLEFQLVKVQAMPVHIARSLTIMDISKIDDDDSEFRLPDAGNGFVLGAGYLQ